MAQVAIPVYVRHSLSWVGGTQGRLDITVGPKQTMGRTVEQVWLYSYHHHGQEYH